MKKPLNQYEVEDFPPAVVGLWRALDATEKVEHQLRPTEMQHAPEVADQLAPTTRAGLRATVNHQVNSTWRTLHTLLRAYKINPKNGEQRLNQLKDQLRA